MEALARPLRSQTTRLLGKILIEDRIITPAQLDECLADHAASGLPLGDILVKKKYATEEQIIIALGKQNGLPYIPLGEYEIDPEVCQAVSEEMARRYKIIPVDRTGNTLTVALSDPANIFLLDDIRLRTRMEIIPLLSKESDIEAAINKYYGSTADAFEQLIDSAADDVEVVEHRNDDDNSLDDAEAAPVIKLVNLIIAEAIRNRVSDIHIEPLENAVQVRYRIDGRLKQMPSPPKRLQPAMVSRLKIMCGADIAERRKPQDGRFEMKTGNKKVDFRVSFLPTIFGEKVVIRLLDPTNLMLDMTRLGFEPESLAKFEKAILKPYGMILVTGPTGSGKSTTLYSALSRINDPEKNLITVEDPVEFQVRGINQVQAHPEAGLTFAAGLRSILRQDPDIIMIGEIRDLETAEIAVKAALTGHLLLSTLHTNDAPSAIQRLTNMGIEPFLVTASLILVVAQRLVRRVCPNCKETYTPPPELLEELGLPAGQYTFAKGHGCSQCTETGYKGRIALYEVMEMTEELSDGVIRGLSTHELRQIARKNGMLTLRESGVRKICEGLTTPEEVCSASVV
ncbi:type IV-A pilus assembly ATPase PilB [bacterium]|nr:type IV-A pilus assembly ATPase PilB [bacterium]